MAACVCTASHILNLFTSLACAGSPGCGGDVNSVGLTPIAIDNAIPAVTSAHLTFCDARNAKAPCSFHTALFVPLHGLGGDRVALFRNNLNK